MNEVFYHDPSFEKPPGQLRSFSEGDRQAVQAHEPASRDEHMNRNLNSLSGFIFGFRV